MLQNLCLTNTTCICEDFQNLKFQHEKNQENRCLALRSGNTLWCKNILPSHWEEWFSWVNLSVLPITCFHPAFLLTNQSSVPLSWAAGTTLTLQHIRSRPLCSEDEVWRSMTLQPGQCQWHQEDPGQCAEDSKLSTRWLLGLVSSKVNEWEVRIDCFRLRN